MFTRASRPSTLLELLSSPLPRRFTRTSPRVGRLASFSRSFSLAVPRSLARNPYEPSSYRVRRFRRERRRVPPLRSSVGKVSVGGDRDATAGARPVSFPTMPLRPELAPASRSSAPPLSGAPNGRFAASSCTFGTTERDADGGSTFRRAGVTKRSAGGVGRGDASSPAQIIVVRREVVESPISAASEAGGPCATAARASGS